MKNLLLLSILTFCNNVTFAQTFDFADYQAKQRQAVIDKINPVFAKIETKTKDGWKAEIILKTDSARIVNIEKFTEGYFLYDSEIVEINTVYTRWEKRKCENCCCMGAEECYNWMLAEKLINTTETINIYRRIDEYNPTNSENDNTENSRTKTSNLNLISAFPNPFTDKLTIQSKDKIINISITDISGKIVFQQNANQNELVLDLQHLAKGNYVLSVETVVGNEVVKLLK
jgi:hypothetical protein